MSLLPVCLLLMVSVQTAVSGPLSVPLNDFSVSLFSQLVRENEGQNVLVSPFSVSTGLALVLLGARGATAQTMEKALSLDQVKGNSGQSVHQLFNQLMEYEINNGTSVSVANYLMMQKEDPSNTALAKFKSDVSTLYPEAARVDDFDFTDPKAREEIVAQANKWVKKETDGLIESIVEPPLDPTTRLILLNAVHFEGKWEHPFSKGSTYAREFYNHGTEAKIVDFMNGHDRTYPAKKITVSGQAVQAVEFPYEKDNISMVVLLPDEKEGLKTILSSSDLKSVVGSALAELDDMEDSDVDVSLPKFEFDTKYDLKPSFEALGLGPMFAQDADYSGITGRADLTLSAVTHKAKIVVDEEGTKAAAVTSFEFNLLSLKFPPPIQFVADHPFLFYIKDHAADVILFMGTVEQL